MCVCTRASVHMGPVRECMRNTLSNKKITVLYHTALPSCMESLIIVYCRIFKFSDSTPGPGVVHLPGVLLGGASRTERTQRMAETVAGKL